MSKDAKSKIDWLNHFVGFISVVLGVVMAFWLNNWSEERTEERSIRTALQNIKSEMIKNQLSIDSVMTENALKSDLLDDFLKNTNEKMEISVSGEEWEKLVEKYPFGLKSGSSSISITVDLYQLSEVAWVTTHRTGVLSSIDFDLAFTLEETYDLQEKVNEFDASFISDLREISINNKDSFARLGRSLGLANMLAINLRDNAYPESIKAINRYLNE